jgi:fructokinase
MRPGDHPENSPVSRILTFGEILWDVLPSGEVIGGAPFNVAAHAVRCGLAAAIFSRVGTDARGARAHSAILRLGVDDRWVQTDSTRPTGRVDVSLDANGQPSYSIARDVAWDAIESATEHAAEQLAASGFSALVCGTLAQRSLGSRRALHHLRLRLPNVPVFYDVNLRGEETPMEIVRATLSGVTIVKLNHEEAAVLSDALWKEQVETEELFRRLQAAYGLKILICTRGARGSTVVSDEGRVDVPSAPVSVVSAVGAGDAFSAAFLAGWLRGKSLASAVENANLLGGYVASQRETIPEYPPALLARLRA